MNKVFYINPLTQEKITYCDLVEDLKKVEKYSQYCKCNNYYEIFLQIIFSMLLEREIVLLDYDFTDEEISRMINGDFQLIKEVKIEKYLLADLTEDNLIERLLDVGKNWKITLFTSGTTGLPKRISHTLSSISRFVKRNDRHSNDVWGFAYNPTHMAGLQVFFQALFNKNTVIRLFGANRDLIIDSIKQFQISNISATPTFYRLLLPPDEKCSSVRRLTSGGEKFDARTLELLQKMFPEAKIVNVYASTEAGTLFASNGDVFSIKENMRELVKIQDAELILHKSLIGETTSEKFEGDWYATGDLIEVVSEEPFAFKFISRKNEMINVGGYKVNPNEVEDVLRSYEGIDDVFVYGKKNALLGSIVCCQVVLGDKAITESLLREFLSGQLQEFKIPRMIKFVDALQITRTGKLSRK
jgi:acyl-coenzyme A synthetase/AMP-(fatty) acid ligase